MLWKALTEHWRLYLTILMLFVITLMGKLITYYHDSYKKADDALKIARQTITDMQTRQRDVANLDAKYTKELNDAKETIAQLERDVVAGTKRLQINAKCPATTSSVADATAPRLSDSAQRDYFTLRERIETVTKQLSGLQEYVRTQCLK